MAQVILTHVENRETLDLDATTSYAAILGAHPSKGARSPLLWNAAFAGLGISAKMHAMDVAPEYLHEVVKELKNDLRFVGGAVTTPHKQTISAFLDEVEKEARLIGAVNALYRRDGRLVGANTDGAAARESLEFHAGPIAGKTVLLMGLGGAGQAVGVYLARAIGSQGKLLIANRTLDTARAFQQKVESICPTAVVAWPISSEVVAHADIIVNATTLGFNGSGQENQSPIDVEALASLRPTNFVFDVIYQPLETPLLRFAREHGAHTLNGKEMNLKQAVIAFEKAASGMRNPVPQTSVKTIMSSV
ncbi:shikimate dehydrogenase [Candidatus Uhrbacteria bacterium]|nr:shikimate dehydrogenase [Candidatus Uhrbacteria bacterium]